MARATAIYTNFTGGQISDSMDGRVDTIIYQNGCKQLENFLVTQQGSAKRRQGLRFINEVKDSTKAVRLIPFEFSEFQTYVLEFGENYIRFYKDGGIILDGAVPYQISTIYTEDDIFNIRFAQNKDLLYMVDGNNIPQVLSRLSDTNWNIQDVIFLGGPFLSLNTAKDGGDKITNGDFTDVGSGEVFDGWADISIGSSSIGRRIIFGGIGGNIPFPQNEMQFYVVAGDAAIAEQIVGVDSISQSFLFIMQILAGSATIKIGTSSGADDVLPATVVTYSLGNSYKYINVPPPGVTTLYLQISSTINGTYIDNVSLKAVGVKLKLVSTSGYTQGSIMELQADASGVFNVDHVSSLWKLIDGTNSVIVRCLSYIDDTTLQVQAMEAVPTALQNIFTDEWQEGAWNMVQGYPRIITFFEQRLVLASTLLSPQTIWFSVSGVYDDFDTGTAQEDEAFERQIASAKLNTIQWIAEAKDVLVIGTTGGEFIMTGGGDNNGFTPANVMLRKHRNYGSAFIAPVNAEGNILFAQRNARILRVFGYTLEQDGYSGDDATVYADDILSIGIKEMAYQSKKSRAIWCVLNDGDIANLTYEPSQQIRAWSKQITDGDFESVAVICGDDADEVWVVVKRNIDGSDVRYIERFEPETEDVFMVDSGLEYSGVSVSTVSGLEHLEGETVDVVNGGVAETQKTVASGEITLDNPTTSAIVGLPYVSDLRTRRAEVASQNGPAQGKPKTIYKSITRFSKTLGGKYSVDGTNFYDLELGTSEFSADKEIMMPNGWDRYGDIYMRQDSPYPMNIQLIHLMVNTNDL